MNEYLTFSNGTVIPGKAREDVNVLFVYLEGISMANAQTLLSNPDNVKTIIYHYYKVDLTFEGYTRLAVINDDGYRIIAMLEKDGVGNGAE